MAAHPVLRTDVNFKVFLEYEPEVCSLFQTTVYVLLMFTFVLICFACFVIASIK